MADAFCDRLVDQDLVKEIVAQVQRDHPGEHVDPDFVAMFLCELGASMLAARISKRKGDA
jgi:hypothetical protein